MVSFEGGPATHHPPASSSFHTPAQLQQLGEQQQQQQQQQLSQNPLATGEDLHKCPEVSSFSSATEATLVMEEENTLPDDHEDDEEEEDEDDNDTRDASHQEQQQQHHQQQYNPQQQHEEEALDQFLEGVDDDDMMMMEEEGTPSQQQQPLNAAAAADATADDQAMEEMSMEDEDEDDETNSDFDLSDVDLDLDDVEFEDDMEEEDPPALAARRHRRSSIKPYSASDVFVSQSHGAWKSLPKPNLPTVMIRSQSLPVTRTEQRAAATPKRVSFATIQVRGYDQTIGDHPSVSIGPPIGLDWDYQEFGNFDVDQFEATRGPRRKLRHMCLKNRLADQRAGREHGGNSRGRTERGQNQAATGHDQGAPADAKVARSHAVGQAQGGAEQVFYVQKVKEDDGIHQSAR
eukprot:CAMPEP_0168836996 /NCGR_PEP_ID=MMETSP0727-20121128/4899_1 /TAXON_ID=265536 /ORGANISM="Amphiprora sp., Strain CCMP467" /LENGTH=403 /DNA_ID=CAMNT_0008890405 /DNA_START=133 /DNA_END=1341 /DNA_ORIENTATION=+